MRKRAGLPRRLLGVRATWLAVLALLICSGLEAQDPVGRWKDQRNRDYEIGVVQGGGAIWMATPNGVRLTGPLTGRTLELKYAYRSNATNNPAFFQNIPAAVLQQLERDRDGFRFSGTIEPSGGTITGRFSTPRFNNTAVVGWDPIPATLTRQYSATRQVTLNAPGGLWWSKGEEDKVEICIDLPAGATAAIRAFILTARRLPDGAEQSFRVNTEDRCVSFDLKVSEQEGAYEVVRANAVPSARWAAGRYRLSVRVLDGDPSIRYRLPESLDMNLHPPVRIEIFDKTTREVIVSRDAQATVGRAIQEQELQVIILESPYQIHSEDTVRLSVTSSKETITQDLQRRESAGTGQAIWEHRGNFVVAKYSTSAISSNQIKVERQSDNLTFTAKRRSVRVRINRSGHWKVAEMLREEFADLRALYRVLGQNPNITRNQRRELIAKEGLAQRAVELHDRGDAPAYLLIGVMKKYLQLLRLDRAQLGSFDTSRVIDPALLTEGMRGTPVPVPYQTEHDYFLEGKRVDAVALLNQDLRQATSESLGVIVSIPQAILDTPKLLAENITVLLDGRKLDGSWASSDDQIAAAVDFGSMAFGPMVRGFRALRPRLVRSRNLVSTDNFRRVEQAQDALNMPNMSAVRAQKILQAHEVGRPPYTWSDHRRKMRLLTSQPPQGAGLSTAQADLLMRRGITGFATPTPGNRLPAAQRRRFNQLQRREATSLSRTELEELQRLRTQAGDQIDPAPGSSAHKASRWDNYKKDPNKEGWDYDRWSGQYDRNMDNWRRGLEDQDNALRRAGVTNNDSSGQRYTFSDGTNQTRPDGLTNTAVIDVKSMSTGGAASERVLNLNDQLRLQRSAAKGGLGCTPPGCTPSRQRKFVVFMSSDNHRVVRPSRNLANPDVGADIVYHRNSRTGNWHVWVRNPSAPNGGQWRTITTDAVKTTVGGSG